MAKIAQGLMGRVPEKKFVLLIEIFGFHFFSIFVFAQGST
jgi:hypothetical protein